MQPGRRNAHRALTGAGVCSIIALVYFVAAGWVIFGLKIGPVVATIDPKAGHGVHSGDGLGLVFALVGVFFAAAAWSIVEHTLRPRRALAPVRRRYP